MSQIIFFQHSLFFVARYCAFTANFNLSGSLPDLSGFPFLEILVLSFNQLTGTLPANLFSSLKHIKTLRLRHNRLTGGVPDSWYNSRTLHDLSLAENSLGGSLSSDANAMKSPAMNQ